MADDSTYIVYTSTQANDPPNYSNYLSRGPSNAILSCQPSPRGTWEQTLWWYATGNGCPNGYSYVADGTASTCIYSSTIDTTIGLTWHCDFIVPASTTTYVDGGTTVLQNGEGATITGATQTMTLTETAQTASWQVSIYNPSVVTVHVTSTLTLQQGAHKRRERSSPRSKIRQDRSKFGSVYNASQVHVAELFKRQNNFNCPGTSYYCEDGRACLGDTNPVLCCEANLICVHYDWTAVFNAMAIDIPFFDTTTSWSTFVQITYQTANTPSWTVTLTESDVGMTTVTNVNYFTGVATAPDVTVTNVQWVTSTFDNEAPSTLGTSSTAIATLGSGGSSIDTDVKAGLGVGIPLAGAFFGLLFFLIFCRRQQRKASRRIGGGNSGSVGLIPNDRDEAASSGRPMSDLPQYTPMTVGLAAAGEAGVGAGAGIGGEGPPVSGMEANELPQRAPNEVDDIGLVDAPAEATPVASDLDAYQQNRGNGVEYDTCRRYDLPSPMHEIQEIPGYYGTWFNGMR